MNTPKPPSGPYHDFWLIKEGEWDYWGDDYWNYESLLGRKDAPIRISDDILRYYHDWFVWVESINPAISNGKSGYGFNYYGPTVFNKPSGKLFRGICEDFLSLYQKGPEMIVLTGSWSTEFDDDGNEVGAYYSKYRVEKDWLIKTFDGLASYAKQTELGTHFILHLGI